MSASGRFIGLLAAVAMLIFSAYMYLKTGDWVAVVFALGSLGYVLFFISASGRKES